MSNHQDAIELVKALSGQANVLTIPRLYIDYMGSIDGGLFLNQLVYWSDKGSDSEGWFYKTYLEWEDETTLSKYEVSKQVSIIKEKGALKTKVKKANGAPTVHYKFLFSEFQNSIVKFINYRKSKNFTIESEETSQSLTETTAETTTETKEDSGADAPANSLHPFLSFKVDEVKDHLEGMSDDSLRSVLDQEKAGKNRVGITRFIEHRLNGQSSAEDTEDWGDMFKGLAACCEYDTSILAGKDRGQLANAARTMLGNGYGEQDVKGFRAWWDKETWQGQKGQPPRLCNVREEWGRYKSSLITNKRGNHENQNGRTNGSTGDQRSRRNSNQKNGGANGTQATGTHSPSVARAIKRQQENASKYETTPPIQ